LFQKPIPAEKRPLFVVSGAVPDPPKAGGLGFVALRPRNPWNGLAPSRRSLLKRRKSIRFCFAGRLFAKGKDPRRPGAMLLYLCTTCGIADGTISVFVARLRILE